MVVAHAADWVVTGVLLAPGIAFLAWLGVTQLRKAKRERGDADAGAP